MFEKSDHMRILIIEDEPHAVQRLQNMLKELIPEAQILGNLDSVKTSVQWLGRNSPPDLILMDIQLADGVSFQIFDQTEVKSPVIFTTAYDEYALRAFKVNSLDYLLKPVDKGDLEGALDKFRLRSGSIGEAQVLLEKIRLTVQGLAKKYKARFVIKVGEHLKTIDTDAILYFHSSEKTTFCVTGEKRSFVLDYSLEQIEEMIDPGRFCRINRKYLVSSAAIQDIISYTNSRLKLILKASDDGDVIVARERVQEFKEWLDR